MMRVPLNSDGLDQPMSPVEEITRILEQKGGELYGGEEISQLQHALQCALLAEEEGAEPAVIAAALLHDFGHLADKRFEVGQTQDIDRRHEDIGAAWLARFLPPEVTEPIRLHVDAKRYLCAVDADYNDGLSEASVRSLRLQGGPFSVDESRDFMARPHAGDAVSVRRWDDLAKDPEKVTPPLSHYMGYVKELYVG